MKKICEECNGTGEYIRAECYGGIHNEIMMYCDDCEGEGYTIFDLYRNVKAKLESKNAGNI